MFIFSTRHLSTLFQTVSPELILDIGSGDGNVTDKIGKTFNAKNIRVTEISKVMQRTLRKKGYK